MPGLFRPPALLRFVRGKKSSSSTRWLNRQSTDAHTKLAKSDLYRSRAAYKLIEINLRYRLFNKGSRAIVDLGFAPGAWTQVALQETRRIGLESRILGVDLIGCSPPDGSHFIQGDVFSKKTHREILLFFGKEEGSAMAVDLVLSDMMANTSGIKDNDHFASMDLCDAVLVLACNTLKKNGNLVMKFFTGKEDGVLQQRLERMFLKVHRVKPEACRSELREMYFVALRKREETVAVEEVFKKDDERTDH